MQQKLAASLSCCEKVSAFGNSSIVNRHCARAQSDSRAIDELSVLLLVTALKAQIERKRKAKNVNRFVQEILNSNLTAFRIKFAIFMYYVVGFPGAKIQQQPQAPKPHTDSMVLKMCQYKPLEQLLVLYRLKMWLRTCEHPCRVMVRRRRCSCGCDCTGFDVD